MENYNNMDKQIKLAYSFLCEKKGIRNWLNRSILTNSNVCKKRYTAKNMEYPFPDLKFSHIGIYRHEYLWCTIILPPEFLWCD